MQCGTSFAYNTKQKQHRKRTVSEAPLGPDGSTGDNEFRIHCDVFEFSKTPEQNALKGETDDTTLIQ